MALNIVSGKKSPYLDEILEAMITDPDGNKIPTEIHVTPDPSDGSNVLHGLSGIQNFLASQVTIRNNKPMITVGGIQIPIKGVLSLNAAGALVKAGSKFQSTVQTGTGAVQNIAHGLGVVPSLVLVSIYDTNGVALPHAILEGVHTTTNLLVTVTTNVKYKVIAFP